MLSKVSKGLLIFALCASFGFHWTVLQSVAWVGMMVDYSCEGSLKDAVVKTFDGQHPCPLCKLVREGQKSEKKTDAQQNGKKIDLFAERSVAIYFPSRPMPPFPLLVSTPSRTDVPLLPPPRPFFG